MPRTRTTEQDSENLDHADDDDSKTEKESASTTNGNRLYPYLNMASEPGGILIGTTEREVQRPMTQDDLMDAAEEQAKIAHEYLVAEDAESKATYDVTHYKRLLDGAREKVREAEKRQKECGQNLKHIALEIETQTRKLKTKVNLTVTTRNELVVIDAELGTELERRTATADEINASHGNQTSLVYSSSVSALDKAPAADVPSGGATTDSPNAKPKADDASVVVSVAAATYQKAKKGTKEDLGAVPYPNAGDDADPEDLYAVTWQAHNPEGETAADRLYALVPAWVAHRLRTIADAVKGMDFRYSASAPN